ncbi:hypothetical protein T10_10164 [Trichinella papuae]|uniref:Uncharacterized protein n=1 Tax=Trichinella papuae TaxID=268474 RepID=A0A0V1N4N1_9BILA|nr:hypothetical protein T10_10164 [Trichinella papuae]
MSSRKCLSSPDSFCHICGSFVVKSKRQKITDFVKKAYFAYFGIKLGDQYKTWAPHIVCHTCIEQLRKWSKKTLKSLIFGGSLVSREPYTRLVNALAKNGTCFQYHCTQFPLLSDAKLKEGIFVGPDIQKLIKDKMFSSTMTQVEEEAWVAFTNVNLGDVSEEQGERFHQDIKQMEQRYQGRWNVAMIADYCWCLKRETKQNQKRRSTRRSFATKRTRYSDKRHTNIN